jgi:hypothetical protein
MQAIETRYFGPTGFLGSRVKATCEAGSVTLGWDDAKDSIGNHDAAARALILRFGWNDAKRGAWYRGAPKGSRGYIYVCSYVGERLSLAAES